MTKNELSSLIRDIVKEEINNYFYNQRIDRKEEFQINQFTAIENVGLSIRAYNSLKAARINQLGDLSKYTRMEVSHFRNIGKTTLKEIEGVMVKANIGFYNL